MRMKTSFGNRFMGCRIDSSERSFGKIFVSKEFLTVVIWKHSYQPGVMIKMPSGRTTDLAYLCNSYITVFIFSVHSVSIHSPSVAVDSYGRHVPGVADVFIQLPLQ